MSRKTIFILVFFCAGAALFVALFFFWKGSFPFSFFKEKPPVALITCAPSTVDLVGRIPDAEEAALKAALLDGVTRDIFKASQNYAQKKIAENAKALQDLAVRRKELFVETMQRNPDAAFFSVLAEKERETLAALTTNCVEMPVVKEGVVMASHYDFLDGSSQTQYELAGDKGDRLMLYPALGAQASFLLGDPVEVRGFAIDNHFIVDVSDAENVTSLPPPASFLGVQRANAAAGDALGVQKTAIIMANFQNTTEPNITKAQAADMVFNKVNSFYQENSYGKTSFAGDVFGWYTLALDQTCSSVTRQAIAAADPDIDYTNYSRIVVITPNGISCGRSGLSSFGKGPLITGDGTVRVSVAEVLSQYFTVQTFAHELGHSLGVDHANFYDCGSVAISLNTGDCTSKEYEDPYSIMGKNTRHMNAHHKDVLEWFDASSALTVSADGTYTVRPVEDAAAGLKTLKVQRGSLPLEYMYVEYRQPLGFDAGITGSDVYAGALLHPAYVNVGAPKSRLIDPTPPGDPLTSALPVGVTFADPATGATITPLSKTATALTLDVKLGKTEFTPPTLSIVNPLAGSMVSGLVMISASASDASGISKVEFYRSGAMSTPFFTDITVPYEAVLDTTVMPDGNGYVTVKVYDASGDSWGVPGNSASKTVKFTVNNSGDFVSPTVMMISPIDGSTVLTPTIEASASDASGIARVEFFADASALPFVSFFAAPYRVVSPGLIASTFPFGSHTVYAKAYDLVGNSATSATVSFAVSGADTVAPTVSLTAPLAGAVVSGIVPVTASASDAIGVTKVEFYKDTDTAPFGTLIAAPFTVSLDTLSLTGGAHILKAKAYDAAGNVGDSANTSITVDNTAPTVSLTAPANGATVSGAIVLSASASDAVAVQSVSFYRDAGILLGTDTTAPYAYSWDTTSVSDGGYSWYATAMDTAGNTTTSGTYTVAVANALPPDTTVPTVFLTTPPSSATVSGASVNISASASDNVAVDRVEFYRDAAVLIGVDTTAPYGIVWDSTTAPNGSHTLYAKAYDAAGNQASTLARTITVSNTVVSPAPTPPTPTPPLPTPTPLPPGPSPVPPPVVPVTTASGPGVAVAFSSNASVLGVEFYVDAETAPFITLTQAPFVVAWSATTVPNGAHTVKVRTYFADGTQTTSSGVSVTVSR